MRSSWQLIAPESHSTVTRYAENLADFPDPPTNYNYAGGRVVANLACKTRDNPFERTARDRQRWAPTVLERVGRRRLSGGAWAVRAPGW